jgi:hypothetical protein
MGWTRRHAGALAIVAGLLLLFSATAAIAVEASHSTRNAERIVTKNNIEGCLRSTHNVIDDMNSWYEVDHADFAVANSAETKPESAAIRRREAEGINRRELDRATRVDFHYAKQLAAPGWSRAAARAHFSCRAAYPLP